MLDYSRKTDHLVKTGCLIAPPVLSRQWEDCIQVGSGSRIVTVFNQNLLTFEIWRLTSFIFEIIWKICSCKHDNAACPLLVWGPWAHEFFGWPSYKAFLCQLCIYPSGTYWTQMSIILINSPSIRWRVVYERKHKISLILCVRSKK